MSFSDQFNNMMSHVERNLQVAEESKVLINQENIIFGRLESFLNLYIKDIPFLDVEINRNSGVIATVFYTPVRDRSAEDIDGISKGTLRFNFYDLGYLGYSITKFEKKRAGVERIYYDSVSDKILFGKINSQYSNLPEILSKFIIEMTEHEKSNDD